MRLSSSTSSLNKQFFWYSFFGLPQLFQLSSIRNHHIPQGCPYTGPGVIKKHCITPEKEFPELGSRFKASNVKSLLWWFAVVSMQAHEQFPDAPRLNYLSIVVPQVLNKLSKLLSGFSPINV